MIKKSVKNIFLHATNLRIKHQQYFRILQNRLRILQNNLSICAKRTKLSVQNNKNVPFLQFTFNHYQKKSFLIDKFYS